MTAISWHSTSRNPWWQQACRRWDAEINKPLQAWCELNGVCFHSDWSDVSRLPINKKHKKYLLVYTLESLMPEMVDEVQKILSDIDGNALIFTNAKLSKSQWTNVDVLFFPDLYGAFHMESATDDHCDERLFSCLMRIADTVRQSWLYELHSLDLLTDGFVSYLSINPSWTDPNDHVSGFDLIHQQWNMGEIERHQAAWQNLRLNLPYQNFSEENDFDSCYDRCKYSIVLSTENEYQGAHWFNEKEAWSLQSASVVIPSLDPRTIGFLQEIGLQLILDQKSYIGLPWWQRQEQVLDIIKNDKIQVDLDLRKQIREHNRGKFLQWSQHMRSGELVSQMIALAKHRFI